MEKIQGTITGAHMVLDFVSSEGKKHKVIGVLLPEFNELAMVIPEGKVGAGGIITNWDKVIIAGNEEEPYGNYLNALNPKAQKGMMNLSDLVDKLVVDGVSPVAGMGIMMGHGHA